MNIFPSQREVEFLRNTYPVGTRVRVIFMNDVRAVDPGTEGTVRHVDDAGTVHVNWDNGRHLGLIPGEDSWEII